MYISRPCSCDCLQLVVPQPAYYEQTWHLILPPIMTFLDDYQVSFKIRGTYLVSNLLTRVPPELLLRTGVDGLLFTVC